METQKTQGNLSSELQPAIDSEFQAGTTVVYSMHGKCSVVSVEVRKMGQDSIDFYKLEVSKSALSRSTRQEPAIWVPVANAKERGLRKPMDAQQANEALAVLNSREYYFSLEDNWSSVVPKLEQAIRIEGGLGLAKAYSYLYVLKKKQVVPTPEVVRLQESVSKLLFRELAEVFNEPAKSIEEKIQRGLRQKLTLDN